MTDYEAAEREMDAMDRGYQREIRFLKDEKLALRAALEKIAALQTEEPAEGESRSDKGDWWEGCQYGAQCGKYAASKIARAALAVRP